MDSLVEVRVGVGVRVAINVGTGVDELMAGGRSSPAGEVGVKVGVLVRVDSEGILPSTRTATRRMATMLSSAKTSASAKTILPSPGTAATKTCIKDTWLAINSWTAVTTSWATWGSWIASISSFSTARSTWFSKISTVSGICSY